MAALTVIANFGSALEAELAVEQLRGQSIPAQARGKDIVGIFGPGFQGTTARGVDVVVPTELAEAAREILGLDDPPSTSNSSSERDLDD
jgi:hypothetical protein